MRVAYANAGGRLLWNVELHSACVAGIKYLWNQGQRHGPSGSLSLRNGALPVSEHCGKKEWGLCWDQKASTRELAAPPR